MKLLDENIISAIEALQNLLADQVLKSNYNKAIECVLNCYKKGGRLYIAGNGGSAADAQHLAAEFVSKLAQDRNPLPAEALTTDSSILTAIGNDYGFEYIFSRQLEAKMNANDIFLGISTSGNSLNIIKALEVCNAKGNTSIVFTGRDGGNALKLSNHCIVIPRNKTSTIQEIHILLSHTMCEAVESELFKI
jgi:D-sedoheptulose 7-phosphate isomerase